MIEFELSEDHPFVISLNDMLTWLRTSDVPNRVVGQSDQYDLSEDRLNDRIENNSANYCRFARFADCDGYNFDKIEEWSIKLYKEKTKRDNFHVIPVAKTLYPAKEGYLGWHIDQEGGRIYSAWSDGKSFFRYRDPETKEIITSWDKPNQWNFRIFDFDKENPMWHCVGAEDLRVSIGYRFINTNEE
jgi:hypothetical protein